MATELEMWLKALHRNQFDVADSSVTCWFGERGVSRKHVVRLQTMEDAIRFEATVASARVLEGMADDPSRWAWRRNRSSTLVGFRIHQKRLVAEAVAPACGLTQAEFLVYLTAVATEADRMELVLTGKDVQ
jgi:hypothetical protein